MPYRNGIGSGIEVHYGLLRYDTNRHEHKIRLVIDLMSCQWAKFRDIKQTESGYLCLKGGLAKSDHTMALYAPVALPL